MTLATLPKAGDVLEGKVEIVRELGRGGMGAVFEGLHRRTGRRVAVKLLRPEIASDASACGRFLQEALACGRVRHPNVIDILDASTSEHGQPYLVMELLDGESLAQRIERDGPLPIAESLDVMAEILAGVGAAHASGIVHRDLKPDNVFLARSPTGTTIAKVLDFGLSKLSNSSDSFAVTALALTHVGAVLGTPYYMSPEQARGARDLDGRSDVYSAGCVLFHMLTGRPPFLADNYNALLAQILMDDPPPLRSLRHDAPATLERVVQQAMAKKPADRFASIDAFRERIERQTRVLADVTVMFTDLEGFNVFALEAPVERVEEVLEEWERAHRTISAKYGGVLRLIVGDEMVTSYPTPTDAIHAWLELRDSAIYSEAVRPQIRFRAGIGRGDVRIVRSAMFGQLMNVTARMTSSGVVGGLSAQPEVVDALAPELRARFTLTRPSSRETPAGPGVRALEQVTRAVWLVPL